jgi:hypothetical protein
VPGRRECKRVETGSPGEPAMVRESAARASLVGETERRGGARGGLPQVLPERGRGERERGHPRG